jgi:hypothetical protein
MLSSGLRKVMKALLILLAAAWITTGANATSEGERAPGLADKRFVSTYLYAAVRPATHAIVLLDQAGWHGEKALAVPVGGAIHSIKSVRIPLPHELSRTQGGSRRLAL